mmetsp:Transcript_7818/g.32630  ORF Transcript_7818/g.32630 Transcript_7818/m.32630 type:complete len:335 (-) Transcript_7818:2752-3756(-)
MCMPPIMAGGNVTPGLAPMGIAASGLPIPPAIPAPGCAAAAAVICDRNWWYVAIQFAGGGKLPICPMCPIAPICAIIAAKPFTCAACACACAALASLPAFPGLGAAGVLASTADCSGVSQMCCFLRQCASPFFRRMQSWHRSGTSSPAASSTAPTDSDTTNLPLPPRRAATRGVPSLRYRVGSFAPSLPPAPAPSPARLAPLTTCPRAAQYEMPLCARAHASHRCAPSSFAASAAALRFFCADKFSAAWSCALDELALRFLACALAFSVPAFGTSAPELMTELRTARPWGCGSVAGSTFAMDSHHRRSPTLISPSSYSTSCVNAFGSKRRTVPR